MSRATTGHRSKAEHVAQQLLERIIAAKLKPGSSFATEAELLSQFNVSRPTLRESLKLLESQGVLERRPGPGGGIIVSQPSTDLLAHGLSVFLRLHEVPFVAVIKAREAIEPALAYEAAVNGSDEDFAALEASIARLKALDAHVMRIATVLASRSPSGAQTLKRLVYGGLEMTLADGLVQERLALRDILVSPDYAEGLSAFAEKRQPRFTGGTAT